MSSVTVICVVFVAFFTLLLGQEQYCNNAYECVGTEWTSSQNIYGYGYKSLSGMNTSITTDGDYVWCNSAFACTKISFILSDNRIKCSGSHSCSNIAGSSYIEAQGYISCSGANSCENSNIISNGIAGYIECVGDQSCIHSNITSPTVYADGAYSLYGSIIYSNTVILRGYQSGYGATIKCTADGFNSCNIWCFGNGCEMALVILNSCNFNCNIILNNNDPTVTIPPIQNINDYNYDFYDMKYKSNILTLNNEYACNNATQFVYDNYNETTEIIDMNQQNGGPVCCRGSESCAGSNISFTATTSDILVCSGSSSCSNNIINTSNPVFCEGRRSCGSATINGANEIYCLAERACDASVIKQSKNVYCSGSYTCEFAQIESNGNDTNIYLLGESSGVNTNIYCDIGDKCEITCGGYWSCSYTVLYCNNNCNVYCNTETGCPIMATPLPTSNPSTKMPTVYSTKSPTKTTNNPTLFPTQSPTSTTLNPTKPPTYSTINPSVSPSKSPTVFTINPSVSPSKSPTVFTINPSVSPSKSPTDSTINPTKSPT
eukprot:104992_1